MSVIAPALTKSKTKTKTQCTELAKFVILSCGCAHQRMTADAPVRQEGSSLQ